VQAAGEAEVAAQVGAGLIEQGQDSIRWAAHKMLL